MKRISLTAFVSACSLLSHSGATAQSGGPLTLTIDTRKTYQTIENFSASDAWAGQFIGLWPDAKRNEMADWLFSMDTLANGQPKGIGLSMWRFNLGAGSTQQGQASGIGDEWRRAESFLEENGQYNFGRQAGQQWLLKAAKARGVNDFLAFYNSPPVPYTRNGKAFTAVKGVTNIDSQQYANLASYTVEALKGLQQHTGVHFNYISPVNEPQWDWSDGGQEGCPYTNAQISGLVKELGKQLKASKLKTEVLIAEAGHLKYLLKDDDKPGKGNQVAAFFQTSQPATYIGHVPQVAKVLAGHSYFSTSPYAAGVALRQQLATKVAEVKGLRFWQSEYCILGDNDGEINGNKRDTGIRAALYVARTIHTDLAVANATAWQWWLAISAYDYKDGLVYVDKSKTDGNYYDSKMMWALGNYSRFVRPGMQRVATSLPGAADQCYVSAYRDGKSGRVVAVVVNGSKHGQQLSLQTAAGNQTKVIQQITTYTTSAGQRLAKQQVAGVVTIQPESIVTLVLGSK